MTSNPTIARYLGVDFQVEALAEPGRETYIGRYTLLTTLPNGGSEAELASISGVGEIAQPSLEPAWRTENEALNSATQAAHSAIEILLEGRAQGRPTPE